MTFFFAMNVGRYEIESNSYTLGYNERVNFVFKKLLANASKCVSVV